MGGKLVLPETDANIQKCIKNFRLTDTDISKFWAIFQKLDKAKTGLVSLNDIFKSIDMERNLLTDCLLELLEIEHDGEINFSEFLLMTTSYCFFEPNEILRFCFFTFDQDKTGFFSIDDLNSLINIVHNVKKGSTVKGNVKSSWAKLTFKGDQIDFEEFHKIHTAFPRLFEPAFRLQQQMMIKWMGENWWDNKKRSNQNMKDEADEKIRKQEQKRENKKKNKNKRKTQQYDKMSEAEKIERDKQMAIARRQAELKIKNPETAQWIKYEKKVKEAEKIAEETGENIIETKMATTERPREQRAMSRAERKAQRAKDPDLQMRSRNTVSGADI